MAREQIGNEGFSPDEEWEHRIVAALSMLEALEKTRDALKSWVDDCGGCDHSVGICSCQDISILELADAAIAEGRKENAREQK